MRLTAKVRAKYLDELLAGTKDCEYRQFETLTLTDENGQSRVFEIIKLGVVVRPQQVYDKYPEVPWDKDKQIIKIEIRPTK